MKTVEIISINGQQSICLPDEFRFADRTVSIRKEGAAVILENVKPQQWPDGFFDSIRIDDSSFERPPQGDTPSAPSFTS